jgi:hypothetical protein
MKFARSKNNVNIRLTEERWFHITEEHSERAGLYFEVLETIENPESIFLGNADELIAIKEIDNNKFLAAIYKEVDQTDGFVITAFITRRKKQIERKRKLWPL